MTNINVEKTTYAVEVKGSNAHAAYPYTRNPARIYVRGYSPDGKRIYQETIGYCNGNRMLTTRSHGGRLLAAAKKRAAALASN